MSLAGDDLLELTRDLCSFTTGVVAPDNGPFFERLGEELDLTVHRYASGSEFNGWLVPDEWAVERATVARDGDVVYDAGAHPLGVGACSRAFSGELDLEELRPHLVSDPAQPDVIVYHCMWQYRPWDADWAICMPHALASTLAPGPYRVDLETVQRPGHMLVGVAEHQGRSRDTIVLNAHTCHPRMANDDMAGVAILIRLFQQIRERDTHYSYRLVLGPEHLGTVFYLAEQPREEFERLVGGVFAEMPGTEGPLVIASTFLGGHPLDAAFANVGRRRNPPARHVPWRLGAGNDETVWEAPGYEVPFVEVSRSQDVLFPFPEYHTSLDTPDLMDPAQLEDFAVALDEVIDAIDTDARAYRRFEGLPALSNPRYGLYRERRDPAVEKELDEDSERWGRMADSLLRYFDGSLTILEMAERHELPFAELRDYLRQFEERGLVELEHAPIERAPITRGRGDAP